MSEFVELIEKICSKCGELKEISCFGKAVGNKDGYNYRCKVCIAGYQEWYRLNHKDKIKIGQQEWYLNNANKKKEHTKKYKLSRKKETKEYNKKYKINNRDSLNEQARNRTQSDNRKISSLISNRIRGATKAGGAKKCDLSIKLLGCTRAFYRDYIESKFTQGMTWENQGKYGWHFDHIKPCKSFNLKDPAQQYLCFNYTNYQPLWATTAIAIGYGEGPEYVGNLEKGDRIL